MIVTGLEIAPFVSVTKKSNRDINYIAVPLLSKAASRSVIESFLPRMEDLVPDKDWNDTLNYIAISSGGHPRSLEWICRAIDLIIANDGNVTSGLLIPSNDIADTMMVNVPRILEDSTKQIPSHCLLSIVEEIDKLIVNPVVTKQDVLKNKVISDSIAEGRFFATLNKSTNVVTMSVSPLVLRASILEMENVLPELKMLLSTSGFLDFNTKTFSRKNSYDGKLYEQFHLLMEKIRRRTLAKFQNVASLTGFKNSIYPQCSVKVGALSRESCVLLDYEFHLIDIPDKRKISFPHVDFKNAMAEGLTMMQPLMKLRKNLLTFPLIIT